MPLPLAVFGSTVVLLIFICMVRSWWRTRNAPAAQPTTKPARVHLGMSGRTGTLRLRGVENALQAIDRAHEDAKRFTDDWPTLLLSSLPPLDPPYEAPPWLEFLAPGMEARIASALTTTGLSYHTYCPLCVGTSALFYTGRPSPCQQHVAPYLIAYGRVYPLTHKALDTLLPPLRDALLEAEMALQFTRD